MKSEAEILHFFCDVSCRASSYVVSTNNEGNGLDLRTIRIMLMIYTKKGFADDMNKEGNCGLYVQRRKLRMICTKKETADDIYKEGNCGQYE
ncbi:hypothetical protein DPMN_119918 [Dreissena polymorpha]|uniref:Uncharacterized protein n=1 Tax=Dreissena polymorpha TaxID=45954 RepID=A0A9D4JPS9_DREPO|nr:hypothetical protein DPMN_119918 [Dreissena polymorpha]